ncbi:MAG: hypothetical protein WEB33_10310 [Bacteroidota bacterium]
MTISELRTSLSKPIPPPELSPPLQALWHAARGNWEKAHAVVQDDPSPEAAWVHAHLHKQEGDNSNARYWYARSLRNTLNLTLQEEWEEIAKTLLSAKTEF